MKLQNKRRTPSAAKDTHQMTRPVVVSLFSGAGGLDLGFKQAGFRVAWANEYDKSIAQTIKANFPRTTLDQRSIIDIPSSEVPDCDGIIGGPPCQSWSEAGARRGITDHRGQLFFQYIRLLKDKQPKFFLAENVSGLLFGRNSTAFRNILEEFDKVGYRVEKFLLNAADYNVPQDRERVIIVGYLKTLGLQFSPPKKVAAKLSLKDAIWDLRKSAVPAVGPNRANIFCKVANHEYATGGFSFIYMSRNRVRGWHDQSFTIQAGARHAPIHPSAPKMIQVGPNKRIFVRGQEHKYRRLSVRECARIQTFPDEHQFVYSSVMDGYKMIGNAVPVAFANALAKKIKRDLGW